MESITTTPRINSLGKKIAQHGIKSENEIEIFRIHKEKYLEIIKTSREGEEK